MHNGQPEVQEGNTHIEVGENFRLALENVKNDTDVPPSFKNYAELLFNFICTNSSLGAYQSRQECWSSASLLGLYTCANGMVISRYLDLKDCSSLSLLSKEF